MGWWKWVMVRCLGSGMRKNYWCIRRVFESRGRCCQRTRLWGRGDLRQFDCAVPHLAERPSDN